MKPAGNVGRGLSSAVGDDAGHYGTANALATLTVDGDTLVLNLKGRGPAAAEGPTPPPVTMAPLGNEMFVVTDGVDAGVLRTHFVRRPDGSIRFFQFGGRFVDPLTDEEFAAAEAESKLEGGSGETE